MKWIKASLFGKQGQVMFRALGVLAAGSASVVCLCLAQTVQPGGPNPSDQPDQPGAPGESNPANAPEWPAKTPSYQVVDIGTLGGAGSFAAAKSGGQNGRNAAGMIVGSSNAADNSEHAFLFYGNQMYDLNDLCDLSTSDFAVLTNATSIDDAGQIIGQGITTGQQTHAFLLKPAAVDGGNWSYSCCQWIWKQQQPVTANNAVGVGAVDVTGGAEAQETGWWWESDASEYKA